MLFVFLLHQTYMDESEETKYAKSCQVPEKALHISKFSSTRKKKKQTQEVIEASPFANTLRIRKHGIACTTGL